MILILIYFYIVFILITANWQKLESDFLESIKRLSKKSMSQPPTQDSEAKPVDDVSNQAQTSKEQSHLN